MTLTERIALRQALVRDLQDCEPWPGCTFKEWQDSLQKARDRIAAFDAEEQQATR